MERMNFALRLSRGVSFGIALVLGSFGICCFYRVEFDRLSRFFQN
jgi:hypothetical protein